MKLRWPVTALFTLLALCCTQIADGKQSRENEQTTFSAEESRVNKPVAIPPDVLSVLSRDKIVSDVLESEKIQAKQIPASWFSASTIHLGNSREVDLIVMSVGPVHGANATMFWAFRPTALGHELLFAGGGHTLRVKNKRWKGFREIETLSVVMQQVSTVLYRFDGKRYIRYKDNLEDIQ